MLKRKKKPKNKKKPSHACSIKYILHENIHITCNLDVS